MPFSVSAFIARRYLTGKKNGNAVPLLSKVSMVAIGIGAAALIILFSVLNGFSDLIKGLYNVFYAEIRITPAVGKFSSLTDAQWQQLKKVNGIAYLAPVLEDNVLLESNDEQQVATLKGVQPDYFRIHPIDSFIVDGIDTVQAGEVPTAIIGMHIAGDMGLDVNNVFSRLHLFYPKSNDPSLFGLPEQAFSRLDIKPDGVFQVQEDFDGRIVLAPYDAVAALFGRENAWSSIEISPKEGTSAQTLQKEIKKLLGADYKVETRYEQNRTLFNIMNSEKLAMYFILVLVLIIASFNMVGALMLLVLEKKKDISILRAMGLMPHHIAAIFRWEGVLWSLVGGAIGLVIGLLLCWGQMRYAWIKMGPAFVIDAYPVAVQNADVFIVMLTVVIVGALASLYPARQAARMAHH